MECIPDTYEYAMHAENNIDKTLTGNTASKWGYKVIDSIAWQTALLHCRVPTKQTDT